MADRRDPPGPVEPLPVEPFSEDAEPVLTSPEDVASAGRSCMAIVVLGAIIVLLLVVWVAYRALGGA